MQFFAILSLLAAAAIASPMVVPEKANTFPETTFTASFGSFTQTFTVRIEPISSSTTHTHLLIDSSNLVPSPPYRSPIIFHHRPDHHQVVHLRPDDSAIFPHRIPGIPTPIFPYRVPEANIPSRLPQLPSSKRFEADCEAYSLEIPRQELMKSRAKD
ncbi:uncharacterized protein RCC_01338 [Ramularia collo-cygni]|uniref:Uncharacterized protein n=1 Tax=Ramularia collo-cygni TaxID=112498 RepID=A0A2D3UZ76_9PEZI|nr:uncharacterized protein RCC_01338 [Ramularia collo-cygni]CZT15484.1 uncharacterized protein RCC_01338 [Ramularia collo-cygni]